MSFDGMHKDERERSTEDLLLWGPDSNKGAMLDIDSGRESPATPSVLSSDPSDSLTSGEGFAPTSHALTDSERTLTRRSYIAGADDVLEVQVPRGEFILGGTRGPQQTSVAQLDITATAVATALSALGFGTLQEFAVNVVRGPTQSQTYHIEMTELPFIPGRSEGPVRMFVFHGHRFVMHEYLASVHKAPMAAMLVCAGVRDPEVAAACGLEPSGLCLPERATTSNSKFILDAALQEWKQVFGGVPSHANVVPWYHRVVSAEGVVCEYDDTLSRLLHPVYYQTGLVRKPYATTVDYSVVFQKWSIQTGRVMLLPVSATSPFFPTARGLSEVRRQVRAVCAVFQNRLGFELGHQYDSILQLAVFPCDALGPKATTSKKKYSMLGDALLKCYAMSCMVDDSAYTQADASFVLSQRLNNQRMSAMFGPSHYASCCVVPEGVNMATTKVGADVFELLAHVVYQYQGLGAVAKFFLDVDPNRDSLRLPDKS